MSSEKRIPAEDKKDKNNIELHRVESTSSEITIPVMANNGSENVELHSTGTVINQQTETLDQLKNNPESNNKSVVDFVSNKARSVFSRFPPLTAEFIMFFYMSAYTMRSITSTTMIMDKVCLVHFNYSEEICSNLKLYPPIKIEIAKVANNYSVGHSLLTLMPASLLALFIGSWSDKNGRKIPLIVALIGSIIDDCGSTMCAYFFHSRVEFYYIPAIFTGFSGGFIGVMTILYSYASDISTSGNRTMKYALMQLAFGSAMPIGSLIGGWIFKFYGYVPVFLTAGSFHIIGFCCIIFFLKETRGLDNKDSLFRKLLNFWNLTAIKNSFKTTAKKRPNKGRKQVWLLILAMSIVIFCFASQSGIAFFYVHNQFNWDNPTFSTINAIYQGIGLSLMMIIVPLSKKWNIGDPTLGLVGSISLLLKNVGIGLSFQPWIYHLAYSLGLFTTLATLAGRARISKVVPKEDLGKVFAFVSTAESILPIAAISAVSQAFNATLSFFPGLIYLVMAVVNIIPLSVFIWIARLSTSSNEETDGKRNIEEKKEKYTTGTYRKTTDEFSANC